jgi:hypothetical protein
MILFAYFFRLISCPSMSCIRQGHSWLWWLFDTEVTKLCSWIRPLIHAQSCIWRWRNYSTTGTGMKCVHQLELYHRRLHHQVNIPFYLHSEFEDALLRHQMRFRRKHRHLRTKPEGHICWGVWLVVPSQLPREDSSQVRKDAICVCNRQRSRRRRATGT